LKPKKYIPKAIMNSPLLLLLSPSPARTNNKSDHRFDDNDEFALLFRAAGMMVTSSQKTPILTQPYPKAASPHDSLMSTQADDSVKNLECARSLEGKH